MKIAVLGSNGFIGSNILTHFDAIPITRQTIDLLDSQAVKQYLKTNKFDVIINCAAVMTNNETLADARNNLGMFMNFYNNADLFGKFINTGSGAEFDRKYNIELAREEDIFTAMPSDSYGFGQNIKSRLCYDRDNFYTLRIFNCFGHGQQPTRIFPRYLNKTDTFKVQDKYFDFFSIQDLLLVLDYYVATKDLPKDVNMSYKDKYLISEVLAKFCELNNLKKDFMVESTDKLNYTGSYERLARLPIKLNGLEHGLENY